MATVFIEGKPVEVLLDTGAMCNVISRDTLHDVDCRDDSQTKQHASESVWRCSTGNHGTNKAQSEIQEHCESSHIRSTEQEAQGLGALLDKMEDNDHTKLDNCSVTATVRSYLQVRTS